MVSATPEAGGQILVLLVGVGLADASTVSDIVVYSSVMSRRTMAAYDLNGFPSLSTTGEAKQSVQYVRYRDGVEKL